ncbi:ATP-binding protein [Coprothermobacter platensis]|uniref:ATP-binding protein n=1 Tax=Coprothermobacter platensis TaxID=108819 RepID=UPI00036D1878|nr:ATP-binding protein [Coprothermobacter platensis]
MDVVTVWSGLTYGNAFIPVEIQVTYGAGLPAFHMVGMVSESVEESKERVRYALKSVGKTLPQGRVMVAFLPSEVSKSGAHFDLAVLYAFLKGSSERFIVGEVGLDGTVRITPQSLKVIASAYLNGKRSFICPTLTSDILELMPEADFFMIDKVSQLMDGETSKPLPSPNKVAQAKYDLNEVKGSGIKRVALIAAAGWHHMLLLGNPGVGKTMVAERLVGIMPEMSQEEKLDLLSTTGSFPVQRPSRFTSWNSTPAGFFGSAKGSPGEATFSHRGILIMDEFPQYRKDILEGLRTVLDTGTIVASYGNQRLTWPADFLLVATSNPCPCGYLGHPKKVCKDAPSSVLRYLGRLSGPVADRIDLHYWVKSDETDRYVEGACDKVKAVWEKQYERWHKEGIDHAGKIPGEHVDDLICVSSSIKSMLNDSVEKSGLSRRERHKILRLSRTIADLDGEEDISVAHLAEALSYRQVLPWLKSLVP